MVANQNVFVRLVSLLKTLILRIRNEVKIR